MKRLLAWAALAAAMCAVCAHLNGPDWGYWLAVGSAGAIVFLDKYV